jgi:hypothetical protein
MMNQYAKSKQEEKTIHLPAELEDYGCTVSNARTKLDRDQANMKLCDFPIPFWHKIDLKKTPMHLLTDQEWKELPHAILSRYQPWDALKQDRQLNQDHIAHRTKFMNGMIHIALFERRFDDQGQEQHRNKCAMQNSTTVHQVTCYQVPRQDIDSLMHTMDLSNIYLYGFRELTVSGQ